MRRYNEEGRFSNAPDTKQQGLARFGASALAAIRRYVERSLKRCAVIVLHPPEMVAGIHARVRDYFESPSFKKAFGGLTWPEECRWEFPFVQDMQFNRKDH